MRGKPEKNTNFKILGRKSTTLNFIFPSLKLYYFINTKMIFDDTPNYLEAVSPIVT
jgi:hypothetical protein